ncbi:hypothetical protein KQX54_019771 [Cotesia glomerata]|uniref:Uncharacterized protein n=1 Tax=Cotesia glomerata TaxID=32391 RepID=A0AAV7J0E3_COTGL|nr:hypothetical protein KQX54_019771 [Cotesia glomerata]
MPRDRSITKMIALAPVDLWRLGNCVNSVIITNLETISSRLGQSEDAVPFPLLNSLCPHTTLRNEDKEIGNGEVNFLGTLMRGELPVTKFNRHEPRGLARYIRA